MGVETQEVPIEEFRGGRRGVRTPNGEIVYCDKAWTVRSPIEGEGERYVKEQLWARATAKDEGRLIFEHVIRDWSVS